MKGERKNLDEVFHDLFRDLNHVRKCAAINIIKVLVNSYDPEILHGHVCELTLDPKLPACITYDNDAPDNIKRYDIRAIRITPDMANADSDGFIGIYEMWQDIQILVDFGDGTTEWNDDIYDTTPDEMALLFRAVLDTLESLNKI